jgi:hypothetical protein
MAEILGVGFWVEKPSGRGKGHSKQWIPGPERDNLPLEEWVDRTVNAQSVPLFAVLPGRGLRSVDGEAQFALRRAEVVLGFGAVAHHVVVIRRTRMLQFIYGFNDMLVNLVKIVPVANLCGYHRTGGKRGRESKC